MRARLFAALAALAASAGANATPVLYLHLDQDWYVLPWTDASNHRAFMYYDSFAPTINLATATFGLCQPVIGNNNYSQPFLFYGPMSNPIYNWSSFSYAAGGPGFPPDSWIITITTTNGTFTCTNTVDSPDTIFKNGFETAPAAPVVAPADRVFADELGG